MLLVQVELVEFFFFQLLISSLNGNSFLHIASKFQTLNELNSMMLVALLIDVSYAFGFVFIVCELCQQFCDGFHKMDDVIGQFSWLSYPNEIQRLLPMLINSTQQPVDLKVFGSITCSRETFKKVCLVRHPHFFLFFESLKFDCRLPAKHSIISWRFGTSTEQLNGVYWLLNTFAANLYEIC